MPQEFTGLGQFDLGAAQQLLFIFLSSLTGAATLIHARRLGVISRMMAAPVTSWEAIAGQALGRFGIAVVQGAYIMLGTALLLGVDWGNPLLAGLILAVFAAVADAAAMVVGSIFDNDDVPAAPEPQPLPVVSGGGCIGPPGGSGPAGGAGVRRPPFAAAPVCPSRSTSLAPWSRRNGGYSSRIRAV